MRKSGNRFSDAIKFTQIAQAYPHIPLYIIVIDHVHDFGLNQSKIIVIYGDTARIEAPFRLTLGLPGIKCSVTATRKR
jgi:hypothetical protein